MVQVRKTERERRTKTFLHLVLSDEMGLGKTLQVKKDIFDLKQERERSIICLDYRISIIRL